MDKRLLNSFKLQAKKEKFSKESIKELEKYFSVSLDKEYKDFLLNFGSVTIEAGCADSFIVEYKNEKRIEDILNFLSFQEIIEAYNILRTENEYEEEAQIPNYFIPIAHTNESFHRNYILIHKEDQSIWLTIEDESLESNKETFGFIANSFSEFLDKIEDYDTLEELLNPSKEKPKEPIPTIHLKSNQTAPKTGRYQATLPTEHPRAEFLKSSGFDVKIVKEGQSVGTFGLSGSDEDAIVWVYLGE